MTPPNHRALPPMPIRVITNMVLYIRGAAGDSELAQMLTIMEESDPPAAVWLKNFLQTMGASVQQVKGRRN